MKKIHFTNDVAAALTVDKGRRDFPDDQVPALALRVSANGRKVWILRTYVDGTRIRKTIGVFFEAGQTKNPLVGVAAARKDALGELALMGRRGSGAAAAAKAASMPRLSEWWAKYRTANPDRLEPRTMADHVGRMKKYIAPKLGKKRLTEIGSADIEDLVLAVESTVRDRTGGKQNGARTANMCRGLVIKLLKWAKRRDMMPAEWHLPESPKAEENPPRDDNYVPGHKARDLFEAIEALRVRARETNRFAPLSPHDDTMADMILIALFTGQRKSNVKRMRWDQITGDLWQIPIGEYKTRRKTKRVSPIPLIPAALAVLERRRAAAPESEWVFPSDRTDGPVENDKDPWQWVRKRAGLEHVTFHGLRHTVGTWQGQAGVNQNMIAAGLGHSSTQTTERYVHADLATVRANLTAVIDANYRVVEPEEVVILPRRVVEQAVRSVRHAALRSLLMDALDQ